MVDAVLYLSSVMKAYLLEVLKRMLSVNVVKVLTPLSVSVPSVVATLRRSVRPSQRAALMGEIGVALDRRLLEGGCLRVEGLREVCDQVRDILDADLEQ